MLKTRAQNLWENRARGEKDNWCSVMLLKTNLKNSFQIQGERHRFEQKFIFFHWLFALYLGNDSSPSENCDSQRLAVSELLFQDQSFQTRELDTRSYSLRRDISTSPASFSFASISVVTIQKGFLVWNICNPFVVESSRLPALPKVFILPDKSSSLWLTLA